jgi:Zn-dependent peptidase ImmA (M78 family)
MRNYMRVIEGHAAALRRLAKVEPLDRVDPHLLSREFNLAIVTLKDIQSLSDADRIHLEAVDAKTWSGAGIDLPDGRFLIILHPHQTPERAAVTIMEEVAHSYFGHKPTSLLRQANGITTRQYDSSIEREAYWTAAAALLPSVVIGQAVWRGQGAETVAAAYGASKELVEFRIKTLNLWQEYKSSGDQTRKAG